MVVLSGTYDLELHNAITIYCVSQFFGWANVEVLFGHCRTLPSLFGKNALIVKGYNIVQLQIVSYVKYNF